MPCSRELSEAAVQSTCTSMSAAELNDVVIRQLKHWSLEGMMVSTRGEHMCPKLFQRVVPLAELPSMRDLDARLVAKAAAEAAQKRR